MTKKQSTSAISRLDAFKPQTPQQQRLLDQLLLGRELYFDRIALGSGMRAAMEHGLTAAEGMRALTVYIGFAYEDGLQVSRFKSLSAFEFYLGMRDESGKYLPVFADRPLNSFPSASPKPSN